MLQRVGYEFVVCGFEYLVLSFDDDEFLFDDFDGTMGCLVESDGFLFEVLDARFGLG